MKKHRFGLILLGALFTSGSSFADSLDLNLHSKALQAIYTMDMGNRSGLSTELGVLYSEDEKRLDDYLVHVGLHVSGENWSETGTFDIRLGARLLYTSPGDLELAALAPGAQVRFSPIHRVGLGGHLYYAPSITSFSDADRYREYGLRADYQLLPQAFVYVGYRYIDVKIVDVAGKAKLENNAHVGFKILF
jgi:hypothetical protein